VAASILAIGAAIVLAIFATKQGPVFSIAAAVLLGVGVVLLNAAGIPITSLTDAIGRAQE
jgi:hypothetical protein